MNSINKLSNQCVPLEYTYNLFPYFGARILPWRLTLSLGAIPPLLIASEVLMVWLKAIRGAAISTLTDPLYEM